MSTINFSRRAFLGGLGAAAAYLPLLESGIARGDTSPFPKRCIICVTPNGTLQNLFWPTGSESSWDFPDTGEGGHPFITSPLKPHKKDLLVVKGITMQSSIDDKSVHGGHDSYTHLLIGRNASQGARGDHNLGTGATGASGISLDQYLANELKAGTKVRSLVLADMIQWGAQHQSRISWGAGGQAVTPNEDPYKVFNDLFTNFQAPMAGSTKEDPTITKLRRDRRSVLDAVNKDIARFQSRLGGSDSKKIDQHLSAIREIERVLDPSTPNTGASCTVPTVGDKFDTQSMPNYERVSKLQIDMMVQAMACDITRVATMQYANAASNNVVFSWLGNEFNGPATNGDFGKTHNHHEISHHGGGTTKGLKARCEKWYIEQFAYLLQKLKSVPEGGGTMLDNTVVLWANNMHDGGAHSMGPHMPWILAGSCGGYFKTGRYLDYGGKAVPHNRLLMSIANAMGVPTQSFGDERYCQGGEFPGLRG